MITETQIDWARLVAAFDLPGEFIESVPYGSGHINDTFALTMQTDGVATRYILQRINGHVLKNIPALMDNISRVTAHIPGGLTLIPSTDGLPFTRDAESTRPFSIFTTRAVGLIPCKRLSPQTPISGWSILERNSISPASARPWLTV